MEFQVVQGDISKQKADALVNAANTGLRMGSGVAGALKRGAEGPINEEAVEKGPVELGGVAVTDAYELDAEHVIHAAAMPQGGEATGKSIRDATSNTLEKADELGCSSIVIPALGCGVAGFSVEEGGGIIAEEIRDFEGNSLDDVRLIAYGDEEYETLRECWESV
ncbi:MAG: macro domain-containing protein [Halobacteria archaeon]